MEKNLSSLGAFIDLFKLGLMSIERGNCTSIPRYCYMVVYYLAIYALGSKESDFWMGKVPDCILTTWSAHGNFSFLVVKKKKKNPNNNNITITN